VLLYDQGPAQRDHHHDAEQATEHRDEHHARQLQIETQIKIAGIVTPTPNAIDSPAEPAVCVMLFSRIVELRTPNFDIMRNNASEMTATGIDALTVIPTLSTR